MTFEDTFYGRPNTLRTYESLFRQHIKSATPEVRWEDWNEQTTRIMIKAWETKQLSRNTKITLMRLLGRYVEFMGGPKINTQKIIRSLERSEQQKEVKSLSTKEAESLMRTTKTVDPEFYPVLLLALHAGLRRGEIFGLRCSDIDMLQGRISVSHSYNGPTKTGKSRTLPMSPELANALTSARNLLLRAPSEKIFEQFDPNPRLKRACTRAGIDHIRFHDLRHTFASLALNGGTNPKQVSAWLGHSSVSTTLNVYWNLVRHEEAPLDFLPGLDQ